jgi:pheromone alpha factor receptor
MVALLLPLSSLWASMAINNEAAHLDISRLSGSNMHDGSNNSNSSSSSSCSHCGHCRGKRGIPSARHTEYMDVEKGDKYGEFSPATIKNNIESNTPRETNSRDSTEMDIESMGVRVDKSYSLQSTKEDRILGMDG